MISDKVTPQILRCAEVIRFYFENGQDAPENPDVSMIENARRVDNDIATLIMEHTGAEMMPEIYQKMKANQKCFSDKGNRPPLCRWCNEWVNVAPHPPDCILSILGELGYGKEGKDEN